MKEFRVYEGTIVPIMLDKIDTDQIIPKQYLKGTEKTGYADYLFDNWRYRADGSDNMDFNLNKPEYKGASILIAGEDFGCGSSREHAAWALQDYGFRVVVAGSYSGIFYMNWLNNGNLPITLPEEDRAELAKLPGDEIVTVDLEKQILFTKNKEYVFRLEESWREKLLAGHDAIALTLQYEDKIKAYEEANTIY